jgi:hypothetical protein
MLISLDARPTKADREAMPRLDQVAAADRAIEQAADKIAAEVAALTEKTAIYDVASDYVIEGLVVVLLRKHPEILDWLHRQRGEASMRVSVALQDWLDLWRKR